MSAQKKLSTNSIVFELQKCYIQKNKSQLTPRGGGARAPVPLPLRYAPDRPYIG